MCPQSIRRSVAALDGLRSRRFLASIALLIAVGGFLTHLTIERRLNRLHVFDQANLLFDADPNEVLDTLAAGGYLVDLGDRQGFIHPGMRLFLTAPIKAAALAIATVSADANSVAAWRRQLAMLTVPTCAAVFYILFFIVVSRLGMSAIDAALVTILTGLSFSQLLFGSVPESFPISNLALMAAFLLFVLPTPAGRWRIAAWVVIGTFASGIIVTNVISVAILMWFDGIRVGHGPLKSAMRTCATSIAAVSLILSLNTITNRIVGIHHTVARDAAFVADFATYRPRAIAKKLLTFPALLTTTVLAPKTHTVPDRYAVSMSWRYPFRFTFDVDDERGSSTSPFAIRNLIGIACTALLGLAVLGMRRDTAQQRQVFLLCSACLAVIAFNWAFHSFWGGDRFLYSQHWEAAMMLLLVGVVVTYAPASPATTAALAAITLLVGANNLHVLADMLTVLRA